MTILFMFYDCFDHLRLTPRMRKEFWPCHCGEGRITADLALDRRDQQQCISACTHSPREEDAALPVPQGGLVSGTESQTGLWGAGLVVTREWDDPKLFWQDVVGWFE